MCLIIQNNAKHVYNKLTLETSLTRHLIMWNNAKLFNFFYLFGTAVLAFSRREWPPCDSLFSQLNHFLSIIHRKNHFLSIIHRKKNTFYSSLHASPYTTWPLLSDQFKFKRFLIGIDPN